MTPETEARYAETIDRLLADSTFQAIRVSVLIWVVECLRRGNATIPDEISTHQFVMKETSARVREKVRVYADSDPHMASVIARILQEYEQDSKT